MKRELLNAVTRFSSRTAFLEKLQEQTAVAALDRARAVAVLAEQMPHHEVGQLLGISAARVDQLVKLAAKAGMPEMGNRGH